MTVDVKEFKKNLLLYGADVHQWPAEIRQAALEALEISSELQALLTDQEHFERVLKSRKYEEPRSDLAGRIISASLHQEKRASLTIGAFFSELFAGFNLRRWALTVIAVLIIGLAIGFSNPMGSLLAEEDQTNLQEFLYHEGEYYE